jgi:hypothetical protein
MRAMHRRLMLSGSKKTIKHITTELKNSVQEEKLQKTNRSNGREAKYKVLIVTALF